jgi:Ca2+-transporting ATPase
MWYTQDVETSLQELKTMSSGLTADEASRRLAEVGPNQLRERPGRSPLSVFLGQFKDTMVIVLLIAAAISFVLALTTHEDGEFTDAIMILIIVILNAVLGFTQEFKAERAMAALKQMAVSVVRVRRDGQLREVPATELVPGDVVLLEAGVRIPADARLIESANLRVEEAALTGESVPVEKTVEPLKSESAAIGDRTNMVFMGTTAVYGRGVAAVTETGMATELGKIADLLQEVSEDRTPLQERMDQLGKWLAIGALAIVAVVFLVGVLRGQELRLMFMTAVSLAVAAVPEGLPAVVTISLALGAQRMVKRHALIRRLPAVETLGSVTTICSDKTGTLTENRMTVTALDVAGTELNLTTELRSAGALLGPNDAPLVEVDTDISILLLASALCNDAVLEQSEDAEGYHTVGDPTEGALVVAAARMGLWKSHLEDRLPRVQEVPFTSERKRMTTVHKRNALDGNDPLTGLAAILPEGPYLVFCKGAVDSLLTVTDRVWNEGVVEPLTPAWQRRIMAANDRMALDGIRVLGAAIRVLDVLPAKATEEALEQQLIFVGMTGMIDPPRREVRQAVVECRSAGIRPVMITGDHPLTALNIARDLGIVDSLVENPRVVIGTDLEKMSVQDLEGIVEETSVYARVSPEHKFKIVDALKAKGHFVAMTGDGVNDAPALKRADIGVAMGITGTDVSKEASDMVLLDDNFATIVHAIEEGRTIYENIRKFVRYIVSCNVGEILLMLVSPLMGLSLPLSPVQLLWVNLVTDGLPALALGVEPAAPDIMSEPPHPPDEGVLARGTGSYILWVGLLLGVVCVITQYVSERLGYGGTDPRVWQTMVFTTLGLSQMGNALAVRSDRITVAKLGLFGNPLLIGAVLLTLVLQLAVIYVPFLQGVFNTAPLDLEHLLICLGLSAVVVVVVELSKVFRARRS